VNAADLEPHRGAAWGLAYRMLGAAADADDVVQDAFVRALERKPATDRSLRPWLLQVVANLARDALRRRRRRRYVGPWLPSPVDVDSLPDPREGPEARVSTAEASSYAFLVALEALTPNQRAVLLLRDVLGWSTPETATALGISDGSAKVTLHRARRALDGYEPRHEAPSDAVQGALMAFMTALLQDDGAALEALMAREAVLLSDGGGRFFAARKPVVGAARIAKVYRTLAARYAGRDPGSLQFIHVNGQPALRAQLHEPLPGDASAWVFRVDLDAHGRIVALHSILSPDKLGPLGSGAPAAVH